MVANILIVDDDADLLNGQAIFLTEHGYRVATAKSMKEGLSKLTDFKPDLILADLMMEEYDSGMVFCKKVKEHPETGSTPIIMQTAAVHEIGFTPATGNASPKGGAPGTADRNSRPWLSADEVLTDLEVSYRFSGYAASPTRTRWIGRAG